MVNPPAFDPIRAPHPPFLLTYIHLTDVLTSHSSEGAVRPAERADSTTRRNRMRHGEFNADLVRNLWNIQPDAMPSFFTGASACATHDARAGRVRCACALRYGMATLVRCKYRCGRKSAARCALPQRCAVQRARGAVARERRCTLRAAEACFVRVGMCDVLLLVVTAADLCSCQH
jgi:hypothetical protein